MFYQLKRFTNKNPSSILVEAANQLFIFSFENTSTNNNNKETTCQFIVAQYKNIYVIETLS